MVCHHLLKLKHHFKTEQAVVNGICDIIDLDTFVVYEIESHVHPIVRRKKLEAYYHPGYKGFPGSLEALPEETGLPAEPLAK